MRERERERERERDILESHKHKIQLHSADVYIVLSNVHKNSICHDKKIFRWLYSYPVIWRLFVVSIRAGGTVDAVIPDVIITIFAHTMSTFVEPNTFITRVVWNKVNKNPKT